VSNYTKNWFDVRGLKTWDKLLKKRKIYNALEIGCYEGRASVFLLEKFPDMELTVIDRFFDDVSTAPDYAGYEENYEQRFDENTEQYKSRLTKFKGDSLDWLAHLILKDAKFDFIYVDGDHRTFPSARDCIMVWDMLKPGGMMVIDDFDEIPEVNYAANLFMNLLDDDTYTSKVTKDGEQLVIERI
jgi:predicted O-methyltransferase YrrM